MSQVALTEAKRIIDELSFSVKQAQKFQSDKEFLQCLAEEIEIAMLDDTLKTPKAMFEICEDGSVNFLNIVNEAITEPSKLCIDITDFRNQTKIAEKKIVIDKSADVLRETLELNLLAKKTELIDGLLKNKNK